MGSHGLLGKQNVYEQSMRCPLIIRGPGIPANQSSVAYSYIHDLYATICDYSGVETPGDLDSKTLRPIIEGQKLSIHDSLFLPFQNSQRAVSDGTWKLHRYPKINHQLLFNLEEDPHEMNDLAASSEAAKELDRMNQLMEVTREKFRDPYPIASETPDPKTPTYDNDSRVLDVWQPKWIRDKYFGGRENPSYGKKAK